VSFGFAVMEDDTGVPKKLISGFAEPGSSVFIDKAATARWFHAPVGMWLVAGDYWIAFAQHSATGSENTEIAYDTGGSDPYFTSGGDWATEGDQYANTDSTYKFSIRASIIT